MVYVGVRACFRVLKQASGGGGDANELLLKVVCGARREVARDVARRVVQPVLPAGMPGKKKSSPAKAKKAGKEKAPLLDGEWFSAPLLAALEVEFAHFDADNDGKWSVAELQAFARACNDGEALEADEVEQVLSFFEVEAGALTKRGFFQMYHTQTTARPEDTWRDLHALGYDATLAPRRTSEADTQAAEAAAAAALRAQHEETLRGALVAVQGNPHSASAHHEVALALRALGKEEAAERSLAKANQLAGPPSIIAPAW